ncbi:MarR family winged helix-turn-helix transcriptional regulator [Liquorilactobacillus oeni]|uniref:Transcriptional regulator n=1 Tax=Liquorilactobacillus oeni DSM 19972 TaxID=1423777 RepID=A0A0R1M8D9_9LACO|nr:MarR family transcriptional regulator [Liquorilactobacillus oeni]KRL04380.1 transcriptional regulator [Liquorilactobacillus oeni DSM 19972]
MKSCIESLLELERQYHERVVGLTRKVGLTFAEWQLLVNIDKKVATQEKLSMLMQLNVSTLSRQLARLTAKEFVVKSSQDEGKPGRRYFVYEVTKKGTGAIFQMKKEFQNFNEKLFRHWSKEEQDLLKILLNRLNTSMERI